MVDQKEEFYTKELGTMGLPREIALERNDSNFLFISENALGPG